eukprot:TRINITY_DN14806_c0_g1_i1.p1 TRINITY_DN14806_c0_g1~~TRINITY_DN14806_c0_g1_i1.p1  ORF type:complete len:366 (+),score=50.39 TRINITY_DN14806_c0_g1_i1:55-1152(+)
MTSSYSSLYNDGGFKSGASMWFNLDSNTSWNPSFPKIQSKPNNVPSNSFFYNSGVNNSEPINPQIGGWQTDLNIKPKMPIVQVQPVARPKIPSADEFVHISSNQRWNNQTVEFSNFQQVSHHIPKQLPSNFHVPLQLEKKLQPIPANYLVAPAHNIPTIRADPIVQPLPHIVPDITNNAVSVPNPPAVVTPSPLVGVEEETIQNLYKTELCRSFEETGACRYGLKCQFAHGRPELRPVSRHPKYKTEVCKTFHTIGTCPYGKRCRFIHTEPPFIQSNAPAPAPVIVEPKVVNKNLTITEPKVNLNLPQESHKGADNWSDQFVPAPSPVNSFSPFENVVKAAIPSVTKNNNNELRSRLVIFQQICS